MGSIGLCKVVLGLEVHSVKFRVTRKFVKLRNGLREGMGTESKKPWGARASCAARLLSEGPLTFEGAIRMPLMILQEYALVYSWAMYLLFWV